MIRMKFSLFLVFCCTYFASFGQLSVSFGTNHQMERIVDVSFFGLRNFISNDDRNINNYLATRIDYRHKKFLFSTEISFLDKKKMEFRGLHIYDESYDVPMGGPTVSTSYYQYRSATVVFLFVGVKIGLSYVLESKSRLFENMPNNETAIGLIYQWDVPLRKGEYDHHTGTNGFTSNDLGGPPSTSNDSNNDEFLAVDTPEAARRGGVRIAQSFLFKHFFWGINIAGGLTLNDRYRIRMGVEPESYVPIKNHFIEAGVFVGWKFAKTK